MSRMQCMVFGILVSAIIIACSANPYVESGSIAIENKNIKGAIAFSSSDREKIIYYFKKGGDRKVSSFRVLCLE